MGTNFYWDIPVEVTVSFKTPAQEHTETFKLSSDDPRIHIGKRSAAGHYCWDCRVTLCKRGEENIHFVEESGWFTKCPKCNKSPIEETLTTGNSAGIELGFAETKKVLPTGVRSVCSFSWAQDPELVRKTCEKYIAVNIIRDEYHAKYTGAAFLEMLEANCPVQFTDSIGREFF